MKILNFGSCNIDFVYSVPHIVNAGETLSADALRLFPGGKGLNQSIALARSGATVYHAGCIGNDGEMLHKILQESGVDTSFLKTLETKNGHAIIQVDKTGENSIFVYPGTNSMLDTDYINSVLDFFSKGDMLLLQNETNNIPYMIEEAYRRGLRTVFNPSPFSETLRKINLHHIFCLILNETEARGFTGTENPRECLAYLRALYPDLRIVLTLGKEGCIYSDGETDTSHPAFSVNTVDTTAAGDTFTGYFVSAIAAGKTPAEAIRTASAAAALAVSRMGAAPSIPLMQEVSEALSILPLCDAETRKNGARRKIRNYLAENLQGACLEELAERLGYSTSYAGTYVKEIMGESFSSLLQKERCALAAKLLSGTDMSIGEIIRTTGYENESFFREKFRGIYGKSPLEYRKIKSEETK